MLKMSTTSYLPLYTSPQEPGVVEIIIEYAKNFLWSVYKYTDPDDIIPFYNITETKENSISEI